MKKRAKTLKYQPDSLSLLPLALCLLAVSMFAFSFVDDQYNWLSITQSIPQFPSHQSNSNSQTQVLGVSQADNLTKQKWQQVNLAYPEYRDALVQLAYLTYNSAEFDLAKIYLLKIIDLEPLYINSLPEELVALIQTK